MCCLVASGPLGDPVAVGAVAAQHGGGFSVKIEGVDRALVGGIDRPEQYFSGGNGAGGKRARRRIGGGIQSIPLLAIPFFICAGIFMNSSGVTKRIMNFCNVVTKRMTGGLGQVNVLLSTLMGGLSGSNLADAAMEAKILVPEMEEKGYLQKIASEEDGRVTYISITDEGRRLSQKYDRDYFSELAFCLSDISEEDADCMIRTIEKFYQIMCERRKEYDKR